MNAVISAQALTQRLHRVGVEASSEKTLRAAYSSDASLYRVVPLAVARPRHADEVVAALEVCRAEGVAVTARGGGTSVAGNAIGPGLLLDFGRHMTRIHSFDRDAATATVDPGVIPAELARAAAGLRFGPDPSTYNRCTIGGMIGNNSCGARSPAYGRTSDNIVALEVVTGIGEQLRLSGPHRADPGCSPTLSAVQRSVRDGLATIRTEFGRFPRQVSGYALEHLLPERGFDVVGTLVGSEGTLALVTGATVRLAREPAHRLLVVLGFADIVAAAEAAAHVTLDVGSAQPSACEGIDARIVDTVRSRKGSAAVPPLPRGRAWLFVELSGPEPIDIAAARRLGDRCQAWDTLVVADPAQAARLWRIRADGAGLSGRSASGKPAYAGWEDAAVMPDRLGEYLRDFDALLDEFGLTAAPYGHFGDGCVHARIDFGLTEGSQGVARFEAFLIEVARMVAGYGGSLSGEHSDGRARSALLPLMYSPAALRLCAQVKRVFDPDNLLNPAVVVDPAPVTTDLRVPAARSPREPLAWAYRSDHGSVTDAVHRCTGVGSCRADNPAAVMCPSYLATREEQDSTRGRARVLQEMLNGTFVSGWRAPEVHEALDLCLSCKGCASDCPTGIDMATYKSEVLHQSYRGRLRPRTHYSLGRLPRWAHLARHAPGLVNTILAAPGVGAWALAAAGIDRRRSVPRFAPTTFRSWFDATRDRRPDTGDPVWLFVDTFTDHFAPEVGRATVHVLQAAGYRPQLTARPQCCALTWITTGQLDAARKILGRTVTELSVPAESMPIVGMEPSCTAVLRSDAGELLNSPAAARVAASTRTLAELLGDRGWPLPDLNGTTVVAQPHCHHHAVLGWDTDAALLQQAGATVQRLGGCCGLAGNFGVERGHYDVSVAIAQRLLTAVADAPAEAVILADGFSCRTQLTDLGTRPGIHLAQLLDRHFGGVG